MYPSPHAGQGGYVQHLLHAQPSLFSSVISATSLLLSLLLMISCGLLMFGYSVSANAQEVPRIKPTTQHSVC